MSGQLPRKPTKDSWLFGIWVVAADQRARDNGPARPAKEADGFPPRTGEATRSRPLGRQAVRAREETRPCCFP